MMALSCLKHKVPPKLTLSPSIIWHGPRLISWDRLFFLCNWQHSLSFDVTQELVQLSLHIICHRPSTSEDLPLALGRWLGWKTKCRILYRTSELFRAFHSLPLFSAYLECDTTAECSTGSFHKAIAAKGNRRFQWAPAGCVHSGNCLPHCSSKTSQDDLQRWKKQWQSKHVKPPH